MKISNNIEKLELFGDRDVNCYILHKNGHCMIVDPGYQKDIINQFVETNNLTVDGIMITHGHVDHIDAMDIYDVKVYIHKCANEIFNDNSINGYDLFNREKKINLDKINFDWVEDADVIDFGSEKIEVLHTPGHTPGSVCYRYGKYIFTGDTVFKNKVGEWRFEKGDIEDLKNSVRRLMSYPDDTFLLPGHFEITNVADESLNNKFYKRVVREDKLKSNKKEDKSL